MAVLDDFHAITALSGGAAIRAPVVEDEQASLHKGPEPVMLCSLRCSSRTQPATDILSRIAEMSGRSDPASAGSAKPAGTEARPNAAPVRSNDRRESPQMDVFIPDSSHGVIFSKFPPHDGTRVGCVPPAFQRLKMPRCELSLHISIVCAGSVTGKSSFSAVHRHSSLNL